MTILLVRSSLFLSYDDLVARTSYQRLGLLSTPNRENYADIVSSEIAGAPSERPRARPLGAEPERTRPCSAGAAPWGATHQNINFVVNKVQFPTKFVFCCVAGAASRRRSSARVSAVCGAPCGGGGPLPASPRAGPALPRCPPLPLLCSSGGAARAALGLGALCKSPGGGESKRASHTPWEATTKPTTYPAPNCTHPRCCAGPRPAPYCAE